ncbi:H+/Cl- antiporter ClcA [Novosphingobium hassiacum]|uniref:H+/Cl- antiporter ClcA n=1 Tax=Novosphingobium hassiacum TaxID=173676 RepID=A0A7W6EV75_9SPHN|nr:chloride channel protein [Novosphingobium hassiacum]MBB3859670.1 H+/Cl- antiporter ClcA [Novosphingobium hassiacum]
MSILAKVQLATNNLDRRLWLARTAAVVGAVLLGLVAIVFAQAGDLAQHAFARAFAAHPVLASALTPLMFVTVVGLTRRWFPEARGSGIPQVMAAGHKPDASANGPLISLRTAAAKFVGTLLMLLGGGAVGREGPTVQISAALMVAVHRWLRVPINAGVIIAGGAAGVSAAFNTPLAGVAFAIEELAAAFEQKVALMVMAAVMISGLVSLGIAGDYVYFGAMTRHLAIREIAIFAPLMGLLGGLAGGAFARALVAMATSEHPLLARARAHPMKLALACGIVVGGLGLISGGVSWGTGYETTRNLLSGGEAPIAFGPTKFLATLATALSGAPGGIFAPSLSVGAGMGQLVSLVATGEPSGALVLLGVAAYFTGVVRAPLTAVIIVTEMTADRAMIIPLFIAALIADWVSSKVCKTKLYHALAQGFRPAPAQQPIA